MYITSRNGKRTLSVSAKTCGRVIEHVTSNPGRTVVDYSDELLVAKTTINLIIEHHLLKLAGAGHIAISYRGRKPDWYHYVPDPRRIPIRTPSKRSVRFVAPPAIADKQLRLDYTGLFSQFVTATTHTMSPARRRRAQHEFAARVRHVGDSHQDTIDRTNGQIASLKQEMTSLREAMQMLATVVTNATVKVAA